MAERRGGIRGALESLPAKPGAAIAVALVAATLGAYYYSTWRSCSAQAGLRDRLVDAAAQAAQSNGMLDLAQVADFAWARVSVAHEFSLVGRPLECPMGWDWSWEERQALAETDQLVVLQFWNANATFAGFIDVKRDVVDVEGTASSYDRAEARFEVNASGDLPTSYLLTPAEL